MSPHFRVTMLILFGVWAVLMLVGPAFIRLAFFLIYRWW
jgi:hypothetical protein